MKYIVVLGDGMADEPLEELGGQTPLGYARTPAMDQMARDGACGMLRTIPDGFEAGSDIANMAVLGYAPEKYYTGRGPLEALSMGVDLAPDDVAYRCNLVTIEEDTMADFSAGHITSAEGQKLFTSLQEAVPDVLLRAGVSYRNLLIYRGGLPIALKTVVFMLFIIDSDLSSGAWPARAGFSFSRSLSSAFFLRLGMVSRVMRIWMRVVTTTTIGNTSQNHSLKAFIFQKAGYPTQNRRCLHFINMNDTHLRKLIKECSFFHASQ